MARNLHYIPTILLSGKNGTWSRFIFNRNKSKIWMGVGGKKVSTLAEELHKPVRRKFKRRRVLVNGIDKIWAAD